MGRRVGLSCSERKGLPSREMEGCGGLWEWSSVGQAPSPIVKLEADLSLEYRIYCHAGS